MNELFEPEKVAAKTAKGISYGNEIEEGIHTEGPNVGEKWYRDTGRRILWLTAEDGSEVCLPGAVIALEPGGTMITIVVDRGEFSTEEQSEPPTEQP